MKSNDFKKLQQKWYQKLARSGFEDIEDTNSERELLHTWDSLYFLSRYEVDQFHAKERYYQLANQFLEEHEFDTSWAKGIWACHCDGMSGREIIRVRGIRKRKSKDKVFSTIRMLEEIMLGRRKNNY